MNLGFGDHQLEVPFSDKGERLVSLRMCLQRVATSSSSNEIKSSMFFNPAVDNALIVSSSQPIIFRRSSKVGDGGFAVVAIAVDVGVGIVFDILIMVEGLDNEGKTKGQNRRFNRRSDD
jgi:hypothetical protein